MSKLWLQTVALTTVFSVGVPGVVLLGQYLAPAVPIEVGNIPFPTVGPAAVAVSLIAIVGADGRVSDTQLVDAVGSTLSGRRQAATLVGYEENSISAAKHWKFSPAIDASTMKPTQSVASITFVYDRILGYGQGPNLGPEVLPTLNTAVTKTAQYVPPLPRSVYRGQYPWNSVGIGAVVLLLDIEADGSVVGVKLLRSIPSLDEPSMKAAKKWTFLPARYMGKSIRSTTTAALIYLSLLVGNRGKPTGTLEAEFTPNASDGNPQGSFLQQSQAAAFFNFYKCCLALSRAAK